MSTHALYQVWVGIRYDDLPDHPFVDKVMGGELKGAEEGGLGFETIYMHGEEAGMGVQVFELEWVARGDPIPEYDSSTTHKAVEILSKVWDIFARLGITVEPKIFHHLDLGG